MVLSTKKTQLLLIFFAKLLKIAKDIVLHSEYLFVLSVLLLCTAHTKYYSSVLGVVAHSGYLEKVQKIHTQRIAMLFSLKNARIVTNSIKLLMVGSLIVYGIIKGTPSFIKNIYYSIRKKCIECSNNTVSNHKLNKIFYLSKKNNTCFDCFIKNNNLEDALTKIKGLYACTCNNPYNLTRVATYWRFYCPFCERVELKKSIIC